MRIWFGLLCLVSLLAADEPRLEIDSGGHQAIIRTNIFTSDGKYLISAGDDKVIRIWDVATGTTIRTIRGQTGDGSEGKIDAVGMTFADDVGQDLRRRKIDLDNAGRALLPQLGDQDVLRLAVRFQFQRKHAAPFATVNLP